MANFWRKRGDGLFDGADNTCGIGGALYVGIGLLAIPESRIAMNAERTKLTERQRDMLRRLHSASRGPLHEFPVVVDDERYELLMELQQKGMVVVKNRLEELEEGHKYRMWITPLGWARSS